MTVIDWARSVKPDLVRMQQQHGIPALWAAAQMAHESAVDSGTRLSELARLHHNYAGLKWADDGWQAEFGCKPVRMGTWEVIDGQAVDVIDAFCSCPDWHTWLRVYAALLTGPTYKAALQYAAAPLLYGWAVWRAGWATDPAYVAAAASWVARLWPDYADSLPDPPRPAVAIRDAGGRTLCAGWRQAGRTVTPARDLAEAMGLQLTWDAGDPAADGDEALTLRWPGRG